MTRISINGHQVSVPPGTMLASALLGSGAFRFRDSVSGEPRAPLCGMGVCFECRVTVDGHPHARSCQLPVKEGMEVKT